MRHAPRFKCAIIFAFVISKSRIDVIKAAHGELDRLEHGAWRTCTIEHHPLLADTRALLALARTPARRGLAPLEDQRQQLARFTHEVLPAFT